MFSSRGFEAPLEVQELSPVRFAGYRLLLSRLRKIFVMDAWARGVGRMRDGERRLQRRDAGTMLTFFAQRRELAFLDSFLELDEFRLPTLAIRGLGGERLGQPPTLGLMFVSQRCEPSVFSDGLLDLITCRSLTFFMAHSVDLGALDGVLEAMRLRLVAEAEQQ